MKYKTVLTKSNNKYIIHNDVLINIYRNGKYVDKNIILFSELSIDTSLTVLHNNIRFLKEQKITTNLYKTPINTVETVVNGQDESKPMTLSISEEPLITKDNYAVFLLHLEGVSNLSDPMVALTAHISHLTMINIESLTYTTEMEIFANFLSYGSSFLSAMTSTSQYEATKAFQRIEFVIWKSLRVIDKIGGRIDEAGRRYVQKFIELRDNYKFYSQEYIGQIHYGLLPKFEPEDTLTNNQWLWNYVDDVLSRDSLDELSMKGRSLKPNDLENLFSEITARFNTKSVYSYLRQLETYTSTVLIDILPNYYLTYHREMTSKIYPKAAPLSNDDFLKFTEKTEKKIENIFYKESSEKFQEGQSQSELLEIIQGEMKIWRRSFTKTNEFNRNKLSGVLTIVILLFWWVNMMIPANILLLFQLPEFFYRMALLPSQLFFVLILTYLCFNSFDIPSVTAPIDELAMQSVRLLILPVVWKIFWNISGDLLTLLNNEKWSMLKALLKKYRNYGPNWFFQQIK